MNLKQTRIFKNILDRYSLSQPKTFMQHRNLTEFRSFQIERINPTHHIILYGRLKRKYQKDGYSNKIIKVGELFLSAFIFALPVNYILYSVGTFILSFIMYNIFFEIDLEKRLNACWYSWSNRFRKNNICC